jgi:hypothetical protein
MTFPIANWAVTAIARLVLVPTLILGLAGCTVEGVYWLVSPKERIDVIMPAGYEGPVLIAYQISEGVVPEKEGDVWRYSAGKDGASLLQIDPPRGVGQYEFFYQKADGALQPIPHSTCFDDVESEGVVVCTAGHYETYHGHRLKPTAMFFVGKLADWRQFVSSFETFDSMYERHIDLLALPKE